MPLERLQKLIGQTGLYSRREAEMLMKQGHVFVDGKKITVLGTKVDSSTAKISVKGKKLNLHRSTQVILFHKPKKSVVSSHDELERSTVYDFLPQKFSSFKPLGRLDYDAEGLVVLTNDATLVAKYQNPQAEIKRIFDVKVTPKPNDRQLARLQQGFELDGRRTQPVSIKLVDQNPLSTWLEWSMVESRQRQIRRMCEKVGLTTKTIICTRFGPYALSGIPLRGWRLVSKD